MQITTYINEKLHQVIEYSDAIGGHSVAITKNELTRQDVATALRLLADAVDGNDYESRYETTKRLMLEVLAIEKAKSNDSSNIS